ncbi:MAG: thiamine pyrophosphate-dependent enzyme [Terracidiphilus sp.]|jgi:TPP-dependent pyruvate/acetoin dehydrogenase alpha subunit
MMVNSSKRFAAPAVHNGFSLISNTRLIEIYLTMLHCCMIHERIGVVRNGGKLHGRAGSLAGHEAALVGVSIGLLAEDTVTAEPCDFIPLFIAGLPLKRLFGRVFETEGESAQIVSPLNIATAAAVANKGIGNKKIAVVFSSEKSRSKRAWKAALKLAGQDALPMIFISLGKDSGAAVSESKLVRGSVKTHACNFPIITVDGNDAVAAYRVASESVAHARMGDGPTLIECVRAKTDDPLENMEQYLMRKGLFSEKLKRQAVGRFAKRLDVAQGKIQI